MCIAFIYIPPIFQYLFMNRSVCTPCGSMLGVYFGLPAPGPHGLRGMCSQLRTTLTTVPNASQVQTCAQNSYATRSTTTIPNKIAGVLCAARKCRYKPRNSVAKCVWLAVPMIQVRLSPKARTCCAACGLSPWMSMSFNPPPLPKIIKHHIELDK